MCCRYVSIPSRYQTKPFRCLPASAVEQRGEGLDAAQIPLVAAQPRIRERVRRQGSSVHRWSVWSLGPLRNWSDNLLGLYKKLRSLFPCGILFHALFLQCQHMWSSFPCTLFVVFLLAASEQRISETPLAVLRFPWNLLLQFPLRPESSFPLSKSGVSSQSGISSRWCQTTGIQIAESGDLRLSSSLSKKRGGEIIWRDYRKQIQSCTELYVLEDKVRLTGIKCLKIYPEAVVISGIINISCCFSYCS